MATEAKVDANRLAEIAPQMQDFVNRKQISGAVTLVAYRGQVIHLEAVGSADLENHRPMRRTRCSASLR